MGFERALGTVMDITLRRGGPIYNEHVKSDRSKRRHQTDEQLVAELLRKLPYADPTLKGDPTPPPRRARGPKPSTIHGTAAAAPPDWRQVWGWVGTGLILTAALPQWPYPRACGFPLYGYVAVLTILLATVSRAAIVTWRGRRPVAHMLAGGLILSTAVFAADVVLPRVGYTSHAASWSCAAVAQTPQPPATTPAVGPSTQSPAQAVPADSPLVADPALPPPDTVPR